jgi:hypothetical protein
LGRFVAIRSIGAGLTHFPGMQSDCGRTTSRTTTIDGRAALKSATVGSHRRPPVVGDFVQMRSNPRPARRVCAFLAWAVIVGSVGCGRHGADARIDKALQSAGWAKSPVYPFAGTVTVDARVPTEGDGVIIVMLNNPEKPDAALDTRRYTECDGEGKFSFKTYYPDDGIEPGTYVLTFAQLKSDMRGYSAPDALKNLYNNPDKNVAVPDFKIEHKSPGRADYVFNLKVEGLEQAQPGPHSLTNVRF